jgi:hypothetical protein
MMDRALAATTGRGELCQCVVARLDILFQIGLYEVETQSSRTLGGSRITHSAWMATRSSLGSRSSAALLFVA